jgi:hypothetical protein
MAANSSLFTTSLSFLFSRKENRAAAETNPDSFFLILLHENTPGASLCCCPFRV